MMSGRMIPKSLEGDNSFPVLAIPYITFQSIEIAYSCLNFPWYVASFPEYISAPRMHWMMKNDERT